MNIHKIIPYDTFLLATQEEEPPAFLVSAETTLLDRERAPSFLRAAMLKQVTFSQSQSARLLIIFKERTCLIK